MGRHTKEAERLAARLRALKCRAGVSYEVLARSTGVSRSTLHRYGTGSLPASFGHVLAFGRACGATQEELREIHTLWALATAEAGTAQRDREAGAGAGSAPAGACVTEPTDGAAPGQVPDGAPGTGAEPTTVVQAVGRTRIRSRRLLVMAALLGGSAWIMSWSRGGCPSCGVRPGGW
ncbi:helix-turn-helix transcriptional regulator [Streptomyces sp. NBC_00236]|uniref:helix-turn-helix domain-containing protein n=1 Tax=unclassified Streptomyces TaxID=2593676 RepID=UPI002E2E3D28|nr:helix-turn-helix transcriptional regulator [Streptomyces sp. NBC_00236]